MERKSVVLFMVLLIFFASHGMVQQADARMCESQSHHFKGMCFIDHNCATVCRTEGFSGGICVGLRGRCFCTRQCT
ncbi:defensin Ec-AMP-D1-like [Chenopodium quinoa]|uniref:defensin Ec-AMP-D1-like n=1 Tax=Chenopodium quinoa TaxID=63459 RepID=UPI000B77C53C|nr:defensin Ec-AMP-D1-like [Chenopodium quinoa]